MEVVSAVRQQNMMTFPVLTMSLLRQKDGTWGDEEFAKWCCAHNMKWNDSNFYISDNVTSLSNCCVRQGSIIKKVEYLNDKMNGTLFKYKNSILVERVDYQEGVKNGESVIYYEKGTIMESSNYKNDQRDGVTIWYANRDKNQGEKVAMYTYKEGVFDGVQETYFEDGAVKTKKTFSGNILEGPAYEFYEDGSLKTEANYKKGELKGKVKEYPQGKKFLKN